MNWEILVIAIAMLFLLNKFFDIKNLLNPFVFFYLYQTVFLFIALSYNEVRYPKIPISSEVREAVILGYFLTFLGAFLSRTLFSRAGIPYVRINDIQIIKTPSKAFQIAGFVLFSLGVLTFLYFTYKTGGLIILEEDIENSRISKKAGAGLVNLIFVSFLLYGYCTFLLQKNNALFLKILLFLFTAFALISYGSRAPLLKLIVAVFVVLTIRSERKITLKKYLKIGLILFAILIIVGTFRSNFQADNVSFLKLSVLRAGWRPFVNIQNLQRIYDFFPTKHEFLLGESYLIDLKLFLPGSNPNFGTYLKDLMNWRFDGGSITTSFIGLGYLNFGKIAFVIYPLVYGFVFNSVYQIFFYRKNAYNLSILFLVFFSIGVSGSVSTGLFGTLINNILFLLFAIFVHMLLKQLLLKRPLKFRYE